MPDALPFEIGGPGAGGADADGGAAEVAYGPQLREHQEPEAEVDRRQVGNGEPRRPVDARAAADI